LTPEHPIGETEPQVIMPDGSRRWLAWIIHAFFDEQGRVQEFQAVGRDITKRKEAEEALRQSELRFRMYTEGSLVGVYVVQDERLVYVNPVLAQFFGYTVQEMTGLPALDLVHPEDRNLVRQKIAERLAGQPSERYSIRGIRKNGALIHCELLGRLVDYQGQPAILGSLLDITQRREAEEALRQSEKQYRFLVETMNDGLGAMDEHQRITYINPRITELLGYSEDELIGRQVSVLLDETNRKILQDNLNRRQSGDQTSYELVWTRKDDSQFPAIVSPKPIFDAQGRFKGSFAIITDITARRQAEAEVRHRERYFRQLTENVSDIFGLLTMEGKISYINPAINRLLGYRPEQLLGKSAFDLVHPDNLTALQELFSRLKRQTGENFQTEIQVQHRNGSWHTWSVKGRNLLHDPVVKGIVINAQDITEQKSLEAALKQSTQKLRSLTAQIFSTQETERRRLSLELHDELGQSLTALKLQLRSIANKLRKDQTKLRQDCTQMLAYINEVVENVRRLAHDLSPSLLENVGLGAALHHLLENYRQFYGITENLHQLEGIDDVLPAEAKIHIYRIFQEILTNIEKHSQASEVRVEVGRLDHRLSFRIGDNGRGLSVELKEKSGSPMGLGLPAISERVLMLGGTLKISGNEEAGTQIEFVVPLHKK
jgi:PAS domain S-box-containing protein